MNEARSPDDDGHRDDEPRQPCPRCGAAIVVGARKCRACKQWVGSDRRRVRLILVAVLASTLVATLAAVGVARRPSTVGEAPPLTPMAPAGSAESLPSGEPSPASLGPAPEPTSRQVSPEQGFQERHIHVDFHPLDAVFSDDGSSVFVSGDDAKIRAYDVATGRRTQIVSVPARGDRLKLLHGRYLAVIRPQDAFHIPLVDVQTWSREPLLLNTGSDPVDVLELPDGKTVLTASSQSRKVAWHEVATGKTLATLRLPNESGRLFPLHSHGRAFVGVLGTSRVGNAPTSAILELFDPFEKPFGATRRSVSLGRDPRGGAVSPDGKKLICADKLSNSAWIYDTEAQKRPTSIAVGQGPTAAFVLDGRHAITLDAQGRTATVIDLETEKRSNTLMLPDAPIDGATSADGKWLAVTLGGSSFPPRGSGVVLISDSPPRIVARHSTGTGPTRVAFSRDAKRAVVTCFTEGELTLLER